MFAGDTEEGVKGTYLMPLLSVRVVSPVLFYSPAYCVGKERW